MTGDVNLSGLQLSGDEWNAMDADTRIALLAALIDEDPYESFELDPGLDELS
jgi:hypothetical protein